MVKSIFIALSLSVFLIPAIWAETIYIPSQYPTIQAGINAAVDGDTVLVASGLYTFVGNYNLDFLGKAIVVTSEAGADSTVIDCRQDGRGFIFQSGEDSLSILKGFKITMARTGGDEIGGGVVCYNSSPIIRDNIFTLNYGWWGGGIGIYGGAPLIEENLITGNTAERGGGIACLIGTQAVIRNNVITDNFSQGG